MWTCRIQHKSLQKLVFLTWPHPVAPGMPPLEVRVPAPQTQPGCLLKTPPLSDGNTLGWRKMQGSETNSSLACNSGHSQDRERPAGPRWGLQAAPPSISKGADWGPPALAEEGSNTFQEPSLLPISFFFSFFFFFKSWAFISFRGGGRKSLSKVFWISEPRSEAACQCLFGK